MRRLLLPLAAALLAGFLLGRSWERDEPPTLEERLGPCRVLKVIDGDTLDVDCGAKRERVRLLRVDTPEREEPGYDEARSALARLVRGGKLELVFEDPGEPRRGGYGRLLAYVYVDGTNVNVEMVRLGWSRFWTAFGEGRFANAFEEAEQQARQDRRGLWGDGP